MLNVQPEWHISTRDSDLFFSIVIGDLTTMIKSPVLLKNQKNTDHSSGGPRTMKGERGEEGIKREIWQYQKETLYSF